VSRSVGPQPHPAHDAASPFQCEAATFLAVQDGVLNALIDKLQAQQR
jgi:hypothetical protein